MKVLGEKEAQCLRGWGCGGQEGRGVALEGVVENVRQDRRTDEIASKHPRLIFL